MSETTHRIGSGRIIRIGAGAKAANLDRAIQQGIDVPSGFVIPHEATIPSNPLLAQDAGTRWAVRSAFSVEDGNESAMAGRFHSELNVASEDIATSAQRVRDSGDDFTDIRLDVLVMKMVKATVSGVAFTEAQFEDDLVDVTDGLADKLVSGQVAGTRVVLPKVRQWEKPAGDLDPWQQRLSRLLQEIRGVFGESDWDLEWADDGNTCWLVQLRPITAAPRRNEAFTIANHKEILPELPSVLMASVIESASHDLMGFYRDINPALPVDRPFIESFYGRPYINMSQLTDLLRMLGLPTQLLADSLGGQPDVVVGLRPKRLVRQLPTLIKLGLAQLGAVGSAKRAEVRIAQLSTAPTPAATPTFASTTEALRRCYVELVTEMSSLATAMAAPVALLRKLDVLDRHVAQHRTAATGMLDDLAPLIELAAKDPAIKSAVESGTVPEDPKFQKHWSDWLDQHGHRGVFESDIARPRFADNPAPILSTIAAAQKRAAAPTPTLRTTITQPLWFAARRPMAAREQLRWSAMLAFSRLRQQLIQTAEQAVSAGLLPDVQAVFELHISELEAIDMGIAFTVEALEQRRASIDELRERRLPDLLHRFDDLDHVEHSDAEDRRSFTGIPLTRGTVTGWALRCSEPPASLPDGFKPESTIVVARSVDAGWVPLFGKVAGVAVEIGGDLSHGSIILRELGLPAVTNLGDLGMAIGTGDKVRLTADNGRLEILE